MPSELSDSNDGCIKPCDFLDAVRPALETGDASLLAERVRRRWTPAAICTLLCHEDSNVRRIAAVTLGLVGDDTCVDNLAKALHDPDSQVNEMAEHGLWSIWFRSCKVPAAAEALQKGMAKLAEESYDAAIDHFRQAIAHDPSFAEAYHQSSITRFFLGQWRDSAEDARQALLRQPCHFGAVASMGHCYTHLGDLKQALDCYRRAIAINPRLTAIAQAVERLESQLESPAPNALATTPTPLPAISLSSTLRIN